MAKIYLVDSENIGASWSQLLTSMSKEDKLFVFYTEKSPYISYDNLLQVIAYCEIPVFIKCYEGKNALDFQLVSELGYKLCQEPEAEFVIVSDDYGYDAAIRYWKERMYNVHRIGKKGCKPMPERKEEERGTVCVLDEEAVTEQVAEPAVMEDQASPEVQPEEMQEPAESGQVQPETQPDPSAEAEQPGVQHDSLKEDQPQKRTRERRKKYKKEPAQEPEKAVELPVLEADEALERPVEETVAEVVQEDPLDVLLLGIVNKCNSPEPMKDAFSVKEMFYSLTMSNLTNANTALTILIGSELGNDIYRELKECQESRPLLDALYLPDAKRRFMKYVQTVLERSELEGIKPKTIGDFLFSIPRKNLNSIRSAIIKEFGQEQGSLIYTVYKPHIKVLNKI